VTASSDLPDYSWPSLQIPGVTVADTLPLSLDDNSSQTLPLCQCSADDTVVDCDSDGKSSSTADKYCEIHNASSEKFLSCTVKLIDIANSPASLQCIVDDNIVFNLSSPQK